MTEELLKQKFGQENHFTVPDGYFDNFAADFMRQLEEPKAVEVEMPVSRRRWLIPMRSFAIVASFAALLFGAATYYASTGVDRETGNAVGDQTSKAGLVAADTKMDKSSADEVFDEMAAYAMIDNSDIYCYLADN